MKPLIVGNWKMHGSKVNNAALLESIKQDCNQEISDWVVCIPFPYLYQCEQILLGSGIEWGAQTVSAYGQGAYTGQVSASMLQDFSASYAIVGHSERRHGLSESSEWVADAAKKIIDQNMRAIVCVGETLGQKEAGQLGSVLQQQLDPVFEKISAEQAEKLIIAYEPVWAIGTGKAAAEEDVAKAHNLIKNLLKEKDAKFFNSVKILYGGSVKPNNAKALLAIDHVDGLLIGGASLDPKAFSEIGQWK
jgi:triosephosphate isomerase